MFVSDDGHLHHNYFMPYNFKKHPNNCRWMYDIYPYEVSLELDFEGRFDPNVDNRQIAFKTSHDLIFKDYYIENSVHTIVLYNYNLDIEVYVTDAGWYTEKGQDVFECLGCWKNDKDRFPDGLKPVSEAIVKHGMIPGIWCEIEMVGIGSPLYNKTDWFILKEPTIHYHTPSSSNICVNISY